MKTQFNLLTADCANITNSPCNWEKLKNKNIFLTGGTGFFGKWFLHSFIHANKEFTLNSSMTVLSRNPQAFLTRYPCFSNKRYLNFIAGDIRDFSSISKKKYDYLIHAATPASARLEAENPQEMYSIIVDGTKHVLTFAKKTEVEKILLISSGAVYGTQEPHLSHIPENHVLAPVTAYGKGKLESEELCLTCGIDTTIARCFAFVGPYLPLDIHYAIGNFIGDVLNNRDILIKGDGSPYRSYLYTSDLLIWLWTILLKSNNGDIYNVGSAEAVSIVDLANKVVALSSSNAKINICSSQDVTKVPSRYVPSTTKAKSMLSLAQTIDLKTAIMKTIEWNLHQLL